MSQVVMRINKTVVSYFAIFLCGFATLREPPAEKDSTQRRQAAKIRKVKLIIASHGC
jgi:hypothetical protein